MRGTSNKNRGYTIVEVMIFLAVSGLMFLLAANFISGKQASAEFRQGMSSINAQVQALINDVGNGFYPSTNNFSCDASGTNLTFPSAAADDTKQGSNKGCVFIGKVVQFGVNGSGGQGYNIYTVAGAQYTPTGQVPTTFADAKLTAIHTADTNLTEKKMLEWGLQVTKAYYNNDVNKNLSAIGFFSNFNSYNGDSLSSGSQSTTVLAIPANAPITPDGDGGDTEATLVTKINDDLKTDGDVYKLDNPNIVICLKGGDNKYGTLTIGGGGGQRLTTTLKVTNGPESCPT